MCGGWGADSFAGQYLLAPMGHTHQQMLGAAALKFAIQGANSALNGYTKVR